MITKTKSEIESLKESLLKIVFQALIVEGNETERSIIISTYNEVDEILSEIPLKVVRDTTMDN